MEAAQTIIIYFIFLFYDLILVYLWDCTLPLLRQSLIPTDMLHNRRRSNLLLLLLPLPHPIYIGILIL